jgi:predicted nucleic acid-binding protein
LFGRVLIPPAVYQEVAIRGKGEDGSNELVHATWIQQRHPRRSSLVAALATFLGSGEAEAIALAGERPHTLLLIDETHVIGDALKIINLHLDNTPSVIGDALNIINLYLDNTPSAGLRFSHASWVSPGCA